ncbi:MAG: hypothetical protein NWQ09_12200 [Nonlabens sp.]|nr:hypothetical protein [Nonlabens sp.]
MPTVLRNENTASAAQDQAWTAQRILQTLRRLSAISMLILLGFALLLAWQIESPMFTPLLTAGSILGLLGARSIIFRTK